MKKCKKCGKQIAISLGDDGSIWDNVPCGKAVKQGIMNLCDECL